MRILSSHPKKYLPNSSELEIQFSHSIGVDIYWQEAKLLKVGDLIGESPSTESRWAKSPIKGLTGRKQKEKLTVLKLINGFGGKRDVHNNLNKSVQEHLQTKVISSRYSKRLVVVH